MITARQPTHSVLWRNRYGYPHDVHLFNTTTSAPIPYFTRSLFLCFSIPQTHVHTHPQQISTHNTQTPTQTLRTWHKRIQVYSLQTNKRSYKNLCYATYSLTYLFTYSMEQSPSWEANRFSVSKEIHCILWNPKAYYRPSVRILSQINAIHAPIPLLKNPY